MANNNYSEYIEYQVDQATMDVRIEAKTNKVKAEAASAMMDAAMKSAMAHGAKVNETQRIMKAAGWPEDTIKKTIAKMAKDALEEMGIEIVQ